MSPDGRLRQVPGAPMHCIVDDACQGPLLDELSARPEAVMARGRVLKHDRVTTVVAVEDGEHVWVVKRYNTKNPWHAIRRVFRTSRAVICWEAAARLALAGVDTARPVAAIEERRFGFLRGRSYFVCEFVAGETLDRRFRREGSDTALIERTAILLKRLRDHGIVHGDMKATNFIVSGPRVYLVDLDATRRESGNRLEAGLARDLQRFLRNWHDQPGLSREFEKLLA